MNENGIRSEGCYYAADHQYRCQNCGKMMKSGGDVYHEGDTTVVVQICKCGNKMKLRYGGNSNAD